MELSICPNANDDDDDNVFTLSEPDDNRKRRMVVNDKNVAWSTKVLFVIFMLNMVCQPLYEPVGDTRSCLSTVIPFVYKKWQ